MLDISPIEQWCKVNGYEDMLVTLLVGYSWESPHYETHVLEWDGNLCAFIWDTDWYEGQHTVSLCGFIPIRNIMVQGYLPNTVIWRNK